MFIIDLQSHSSLFSTVHTAGQASSPQQWRDDEDYLEALEKETQILAKRVQAAKARIMVVTCFDKTVSVLGCNYGMFLFMFMCLI